MDAGATVENARRDGDRSRRMHWAFPTVAWKALRASHSAHRLVLLSKTNQEEHTGGRRASLVEAMENALRLRTHSKSRARVLSGERRRFPQPPPKKPDQMSSGRDRKNRFGLGTVGHASENPWVMTLKNHRRGEFLCPASVSSVRRWPVLDR